MSGSVVERVRYRLSFLPEGKRGTYLTVQNDDLEALLAAVEAAREYVDGGYREDAKRALDALYADE